MPAEAYAPIARDAERFARGPDVVIGAEVQELPAVPLEGLDHAEDLQAGIFPRGILQPVRENDAELFRMQDEPNQL